jgi:DNA (cytosine-5)-methyltransferase 1
MDLNLLKKKDLLKICEEMNFKSYKSKNKKDLIDMILSKSIIDLFAGTGAFSYVFHKLNFRTAMANDIEDVSEMIFNLNFKIKMYKGDLTDIDKKSIPKAKILTAGFPCQPFSIAGEMKGFKDPRSNVFWKILEIVEEVKPKIIILENVKNLSTHDKGKTFSIILDSLTNLEYHIKYDILNTSKITEIPHNRERIYIVCFKDKTCCDSFNFDIKECDNLPIVNFLENEIDDKYYYTEKSKIYTRLKPEITEHVSTNVVYQYRRYYIRKNKSSVCPTLTANMGTGGHNVPIIMDDKGIRKLTPRECFNLQGFPKEYILPNISDNKLYFLAGNAVSLPVVELIAKKIISL